MEGLISIVSVNYNGFALTCAMIDSLAKFLTTPHQIIVVDNGSRINEAELLRAKYPYIVAIRSELNLGFAGGNNLGFAAAKGKYILLLNNDTEIEDDTLHFLCQSLDHNPRAGAVCPKIRFWAQPRNIQFAGYTALSSITLRNSLIGFGCPDDGSFDTPRLSPYAHGAAMMITRHALQKTGPMPALYFLYYEELDFSERIREQGFDILYDPRATVFHKESATTGQRSPLRCYYLTRNRLLFALRNRHGATRILSILYQLGIALPKNLLVEMLHGRLDLAWASLRGAIAYFTIKSARK